MATGRIRLTRKLKQWMVEQIDSGKYQGLVWDDNTKTMFRIPWKHAGKQDFRYDEDAAIFKAWAKFKGKFRDGDKIDPATWKTRLRCALNKSPEFEEVPERSQLDISEPYKVYRIVPLKEQRLKMGTPSSIKHEKLKRRKSSSSKDEEDEQEEQPSKIVMKEEPLKVDLADSVYDISSSTSTEEVCLDNSLGLTVSYKQNESSEVQEDIKVESTPMVLHSDLCSMLLTVYYGGEEVKRKTIDTKHCKICSASPSQSRNGLSGLAMERIILPPADCVEEDAQRNATEQLLQYLDRGIMLASNDDGIFIQRLCQGRVFWKGPCAPHRNQSNKLERDELVKLFDRNTFLEELELYRTANGPVPEYQITLCFGEEFSDSEPLNHKLITIQIEQLFAGQLLTEAETSKASDNLFNNVTVELPETDQFSPTFQDVSHNMYGFSEHAEDVKFETIFSKTHTMPGWEIPI
ncbi:interferon regulatory factor 8-like [Protopterus annectens]|uniref:interferon regulatory factor 8-like n=1 Tax=Protopterus annectens TaxID=7888 RepID=UPI001CFB0DB7|nr:interferon regulatory factor 8-like [Protopterus annectens]